MAMTEREKQAAFRARRKAAAAEVVTLRAENARLQGEVANLQEENARLSQALAAMEISAPANRPTAASPSKQSAVRVRVPGVPAEPQPARSRTPIRVRI